MGVFHFLNVKEGDCSIIQHPSGHVTVVDVCNARLDVEEDRKVALKKSLAEALGVRGNFNQKDYPVNPITYMRERAIKDVFRFIVTHPDMDHIDGIADFFSAFPPANFWDTDNKCEKEFEEGGPYREEDWLFYAGLRDDGPQSDPKRLALYSGQRGRYFNEDEDGSGGGDGLHILAPTPELIEDANERDDYNDASYVILYRSTAGRILMAGDSHDKTWEHILTNHYDSVANVDLLIAPHHGRKSNRSYEFLDVLQPKLTFFGNARSEHLAYSAWSYRNLAFITNNQANCMVVDTNSKQMEVYVTNVSYAQSVNPNTVYSNERGAYHIGHL